MNRNPVANALAPLWSPDELATLIRLVRADVSVRQISTEIDRSIHAIHGKMIKIGLFYARAPREPFSTVVAEVAARRGVTVAELFGPSRCRPITHARQEAMWAVRKRCRASYPRIGQRFGGRDHTTAIWACRAHEKRMAEA